MIIAQRLQENASFGAIGKELGKDRTMIAKEIKKYSYNKKSGRPGYPYNQLCELYQTSKSNISEHIKHIFKEGELEETSVARKFRTTAADGKKYNTTHYNLDMIISLGYRVKLKIATNFRRWATERLKEYMIKGFTMDDERLKNLGGGNY